MDEIRTAVTAIGVLIAVASLFIARHADRQAKKSTSLMHLLGRKESVAFAAIKLSREGLPKDRDERTVVLQLLMQAIVYESSDRTREILLSTLSEHWKDYSSDIESAHSFVVEKFRSIQKYNYSDEELNYKIYRTPTF
jgi:hypothetical protein